MNIEQNNNYYKWKALISFMGEIKRKKKHVGGKKEKKKNSCILNPETPTLALHVFSAFQYRVLT